MLKLKSTAFVACLLYTMNILAMNYGLKFYSHANSPETRTTLHLNEGNPIRTGQETVVSFKVLLRPEDNQYGDFMDIKGNDGTEIRVMIPSYSTSPVLVINDGFFSGKKIELSGETMLSVVMDKRASAVSLLSGTDTIVSAPWKLDGVSDIVCTFGQQVHRDVAPIDLRDIRIYVNGRQLYFWPLKEHEGDVSADSVGSVPAMAVNPSWIADDHRRLALRYSLSTKEQIQTAFDPLSATLYVVGDSSVTTVSLADSASAVRSVTHGFRAMRSSGNLFYMPDGRLMSLDLGKCRMAWYDPATSSWDCDTFNGEGAMYGGHTWAFLNGVGYAFGGYGFHNYNNSLFIVDTAADSITDILLSPLPHPRNASSMAIVGDKLYIFGGYGNESGHQELPTDYYYDLYEYDLKTFVGEKLWEIDSVDYEFICSQTMIYEPATDSFIIGTTRHGGQMIRINRTTPGFVDVTLPLELSMSMRDFVLQLFYSETDATYYFIIDRLMADLSHELGVYSVKAPLEAVAAVKRVSDTATGIRWWQIAVGIACVLIIMVIVSVGIKMLRRRGSGRYMPYGTADEMQPDEDTGILSPVIPAGYISLIGNFTVIGKSGEDITARFSGKMRDLFVFITIMSKVSSKGVSVHDIDETIWKDMEPQSARNNRNVYMRRLRTVLQDVGDIAIVSDEKYYRIEFNGVTLDIDTAVGLMDAISGSTNRYTAVEAWSKVKPYIMKGGLLPNVRASWADSFKADFSQRCIHFLSEFLKSYSENTMSKDMLLEIADTMFMHDELSEEALRLKCKVLCSRHMSGVAMGVYDNFCKSYFKYMGEKFAYSFQQISR